MTDDELGDLIAINVMGWTLKHGRDAWDAESWNPMLHVEQALAAAEKQWGHFQMVRRKTGGYRVSYYVILDGDVLWTHTCADNLAEALCRALEKAIVSTRDAAATSATPVKAVADSGDQP